MTAADGGVHGVHGLHVADARVVPTALGVNPQITIMALAARTAFRLLGAAPPQTSPSRRSCRARRWASPAPRPPEPAGGFPPLAADP